MMMANPADEIEQQSAGLLSNLIFCKIEPGIANPWLYFTENQVVEDTTQGRATTGLNILTLLALKP